MPRGSALRSSRSVGQKAPEQAGEAAADEERVDCNGQDSRHRGALCHGRALESGRRRGRVASWDSAVCVPGLERLSQPVFPGHKK